MKHYLITWLIGLIILVTASTNVRAQKFPKIDSIDIITNNNQQSVYLSIKGKDAYFFSRIQDSLINENKVRIDVYFKEFCNSFPQMVFHDTTYQLDSTYPTVSQVKAIAFLDTNTMPYNGPSPLCIRDSISPLDTLQYPASSSQINFRQFKSDIKVYPNPAGNIINLDYPRNMNLKYISLLDLKGLIIRRYAGNSNKINVRGINSGVYFLRFMTEYGSYAKKVIIE